MVLGLDEEIAKTLHIHSDELPFLDGGFGTQFRILQARPQDGVFCIHFKAQPGATSEQHRHHKPTFGFTLKGQWGHDHRYLYRPGTYVFETPGVVHQFFNGPNETEIIFVGDPDLDFVDPETNEVVSSHNSNMMMATYLRKCEEAGITPRFLK